jgi:hypothetical protein
MPWMVSAKARVWLAATLAWRIRVSMLSTWVTMARLAVANKMARWWRMRMVRVPERADRLATLVYSQMTLPPPGGIARSCRASTRCLLSCDTMSHARKLGAGDTARSSIWHGAGYDERREESVMKRLASFVLSMALCLWTGIGWAASQTWQWAAQADISAAASSAAATAVTTDAAGNTYVAGTFAGTVRFGAYTLTGSGYTDVYLAKYDSAGTVLWAKRANGMSCDAGGLATDGSEVFLTGACVYGANFDGHALAASSSYESAFFLVAADAATGQFKRLLVNGGTAAMRGNALTLDGDGKLLVAGAFKGTASVLGTPLAATGSGYEDAFVFKINTAFDQLAWLRGGGGEYSDHAYAVATDASGNVYIAGDIFSNVSQGTASFGGFTVTVPAYGSGDPFVAKLNAAGEWQWARSMTAGAFDEARALAVDSTGNAYVAGRFASHFYCGANSLAPTALNSYAVFVAKFDPSGTCLWAQQAGTTDSASLNDHDTAYGLVLRSSGNPVVTGGYRATTTFGSFNLTALNMADVFVAELDAASGSYLWVKRAGGGSGSDTGLAIALAPSGQLMVAGSFEDGASFDAATLSSGRLGEYWIADMFLAALDPAATTPSTVTASMTASGALTARTLTLGSVSIPSADLAGGVSIYVAANVGGSFFFLSDAGWTTQMQAYRSGVTSAPASILVSDGMNLSGLVGTTIWFGYGRGSGESALSDLLTNTRYLQVYTIE